MSELGRNRLWLTFCLLMFCGLAACFPSKDKQENDDIEIITGEIDQHIYYVPKVYLNPPFKTLGEDNIYVLAMFPDFTPILQQPQKLLRQGEWYGNVRVLANYVKKPTGNQYLVESSIKHFKAFEVVGNEHGLVHRKQPDGEIQDFKDLWLEKDERKGYSSLVECSEVLTESSIPQCSHRMYWGKFHVKTSFDKRLLPEWKKIKNNTLALLESFQSEETARAFLQDRLNKIQTETKGE